MKIGLRLAAMGHGLLLHSLSWISNVADFRKAKRRRLSRLREKYGALGSVGFPVCRSSDMVVWFDSQVLRQQAERVLGGRLFYAIYAQSPWTCQCLKENSR